MVEIPNAIPDYILEKYVVGELSTDQILRIDERVRIDPLMAARVEGIRKSNQEILNRYPAVEFVSSVKQRLRLLSVTEEIRTHERKQSRRFLVLAPVLSAALILIIFLFLPGNETPIPPSRDSDYIRIKGLEPRLSIYRQTGGDAELLDPDSAYVKPGDVLQIGYTAAGREYGIILSLDGAGAVTLHYPSEITESPRLEQDGQKQCPYAYELDDAPVFERFFFITSDESLSVPGIIESARNLGKSSDADSLLLELPETAEQITVLLRKKGVGP